MDWIILQHVKEEGPGCLEEILRQAGESFRIIRPYRGEEIHMDPSSFRGLIVLGGPMNVDETERYPFLKEECALLKRAAAADRPILGICLGAQLLAKALGARISQGPKQEVGFGSVELTEEGLRDPLFSGLSTSFPAFHWHRDTFDLPKEVTHLALNANYPNQAFQAGSLSYGFQFHLEITDDLLETWFPMMISKGEVTEEEVKAWRTSSLPEEVMAIGEVVFKRFVEL